MLNNTVFLAFPTHMGLCGWSLTLRLQDSAGFGGLCREEGEGTRERGQLPLHQASCFAWGSGFGSSFTGFIVKMLTGRNCSPSTSRGIVSGLGPRGSAFETSSRPALPLSYHIISHPSEMTELRGSPKMEGVILKPPLGCFWINCFHGQEKAGGAGWTRHPAVTYFGALHSPPRSADLAPRGAAARSKKNTVLKHCKPVPTLRQRKKNLPGKEKGCSEWQRGERSWKEGKEIAKCTSPSPPAVASAVSGRKSQTCKPAPSLPPGWGHEVPGGRGCSWPGCCHNHPVSGHVVFG